MECIWTYRAMKHRPDLILVAKSLNEQNKDSTSEAD